MLKFKGSGDSLTCKSFLVSNIYGSQWQLTQWQWSQITYWQSHDGNGHARMSVDIHGHQKDMSGPKGACIGEKIKHPQIRHLQFGNTFPHIFYRNNKKTKNYLIFNTDLLFEQLGVGELRSRMGLHIHTCTHRCLFRGNSSGSHEAHFEII